MSYTHDRDITLEGWIVHTSQANAKGTIKEHRNPILESRCKSKRGDPRSGEDERSEPFDGTWRPERRPLSKFSDNLADAGIIISTCK